MNLVIKRFEEEIPMDKNQRDYTMFHHLNNILHIDNIPYEEAQQAYYDVLGGDKKEEEKQEIHHAIRFLIEEDKVAVNTILFFLDYKFIKLNTLIDVALKNIFLGNDFNEKIKKISETKYGRCLHVTIQKPKSNTANIQKEQEISLFIKKNDSAKQRFEKISIFISELQTYVKNGDFLKFQEGI